LEISYQWNHSLAAAAGDPFLTSVDSLGFRRHSSSDSGRSDPTGTSTILSLHWFPALRKHIESQRVTVGVLIAFPHCYWRQHVPDAVIVKDVTLTAFAHRKAIHFVSVIVSYDDFATASAAAAQ
jgi:hypothetical protein